MMKLPTPEQVRMPAVGRAKPQVRWELVDPWLRRIKTYAALTMLERELRISRSSLAARRKEMGEPPLPRGRPREVKLTPYQEQVMKRIEEGATQAEMAREMGVSLQAVQDVVTKAEAKKELQKANGCAMCKGAGVMDCGTDGRPRCQDGNNGHQHVCVTCGGQSSYWASFNMENTNP